MRFYRFHSLETQKDFFYAADNSLLPELQEGAGMAKKKARGNKSQAIRDYLAENPQATASEIVPALKKQGFKVSPGLVSQVKSTSGPKRGRRKGAKKKGTRKKGPARAGRPAAAGGLSLSDLQEAKRLADQLGGVQEARAALEALEELR